MRRLRLAIALVTALALCGQGLLARAGAAHALASGVGNELCTPGRDKPGHDAPLVCDAHCLAAAQAGKEPALLPAAASLPPPPAKATGASPAFALPAPTSAAPTPTARGPPPSA